MVLGGPLRNHSNQTSWSKVVHSVINPSDVMVQGGPFRNHSHQTSWSKVVHSVITVIRRQGPRWSTSVVTVIRRHQTSSDVMVQGSPFRIHSHQTSWSMEVHSAITVIGRPGPRWSTSVITVIRRMVQGGPLLNHNPQTSWSKLVHLRNHSHQMSCSNVIHSAITVIRHHGPSWSTP